MTYIIAEPCIDVKDRSCVDVCPVDCIHEFGRQLVIDPEECIDCGACEPECPVEAIHLDTQVPLEWQSYIALNAERAAALKTQGGPITERQEPLRGPGCKGVYGFGQK